ncbi:MAG: hypothetical protein GC179_30615 [Anaerolineaceae bacterium]|nr:hypothetical protein [Anaerolineaceae bacterium]
MNTSNTTPHDRSKGSRYQIRIGQHLDPECADWLGGLAITNLPTGEALLSGYLIDQAALHGVLQYLRDLNVPLIEVKREELR